MSSPPPPFEDYLQMNNNEDTSEASTTNPQIYFPPLKENQELEKECSICRQEFTSPAQVKPCDHIIDFTCLQEWLATDLGNGGTNSCPLCRTRITEIYHSFTSSGEFTTLEVNMSEPVEELELEEGFTEEWYDRMVGPMRALINEIERRREEAPEAGDVRQALREEEQREHVDQTMRRMREMFEILQRNEDPIILQQYLQAELERLQRGEEVRRRRRVLRNQQIRQHQEEQERLQRQRDGELRSRQLQIQEVLDEQVFESIGRLEALQRDEDLEIIEQQYLQDSEPLLTAQDARQDSPALQNQQYEHDSEQTRIEQMQLPNPPHSQRGYEFVPPRFGDIGLQQEAIDPMSLDREETWLQYMEDQDINWATNVERSVQRRGYQLEVSQLQLLTTNLHMTTASLEEILASPRPSTT